MTVSPLDLEADMEITEAEQLDLLMDDMVCFIACVDRAWATSV